MDVAEYDMVLVVLSVVSRKLVAVDLEGALEMLNQADAAGPSLAPEDWGTSKDAGHIEDIRGLLEAAIQLKRATIAIMERHGGVQADDPTCATCADTWCCHDAREDHVCNDWRPRG